MIADTITITGDLAKAIKDEAKAAKKKPAEIVAEWAQKRSEIRVAKATKVYKNPLPDTDPLSKIVITEPWQLDFLKKVIKVQKAVGCHIELPEPVADMLEKEAKRSRKPVANLMAQWLQDQHDGREAMKVLKRIKEGKEKTYPAAEVWARHGI